MISLQESQATYVGLKSVPSGSLYPAFLW